MTKPSKPRIINVAPAGKDHAVVSVKGGKTAYRREPCPECPWVVGRAGAFPPEAYKHSANTAEDMSNHVFSCHTSGVEKPATCAGFLLKGSKHNMAVRVGLMTGKYKLDVKAAGQKLYKNYRAMAVANGVAPDDPALAKVRD